MARRIYHNIFGDGNNVTRNDDWNDSDGIHDDDDGVHDDGDGVHGDTFLQLPLLVELPFSAINQCNSTQLSGEHVASLYPPSASFWEKMYYWFFLLYNHIIIS